MNDKTLVIDLISSVEQVLTMEDNLTVKDCFDLAYKLDEANAILQKIAAQEMRRLMPTLPAAEGF